MGYFPGHMSSSSFLDLLQKADVLGYKTVIRLVLSQDQNDSVLIQNHFRSHHLAISVGREGAFDPKAIIKYDSQFYGFPHLHRIPDPKSCYKIIYYSLAYNFL